ncbi:hypothetical protein FA95DRAFT_1559065 [Auriscalpium vulgare]|uniref:Uncharacterized protein n=1 Tax=Auriscalpium vulgare TaxID=40419 RepID=A0ACB8RTR3_9AGAM|nr:hypothetical protein FA95DRAFT_1559065 [Auriscalpium vulgare]
MPSVDLLDLRTAIFLVTALTVLFGTLHSISNETFLDTSDPLLTSLPHPLAATHYFASKRNPLNTIFLKRAWGWTTAAFLPLLFTAPSARRAAQYALATASWAALAAWFFGPPLLTRLTALSGGECVLHLPGSRGAYVPVPHAYCDAGAAVAPATHPQLFPLPFLADPGAEAWRVVPRLTRGHDVSGHVFLLTLAVLFTADQLRQSLKLRSWSRAHTYAVAANVALVVLWVFSLWVTSVYFHSPGEKISGYLLGVASFGITQIPVWLSSPKPAAHRA